MPELPEVETTRQGIIPHIVGQKITAVIIRESRLRWPVSPEISTQLVNQTIGSVERRSKYLLLHTVADGVVIVHLGMSGCLRIVASDAPPGKHDHVDVVFSNGRSLRFTDPRRFGAILWTAANPQQHPLLKKLGPEPLTAAFNGQYLFEHSRGRKTAVKLFIMNSEIVVGVGNIYANEALFAAGIHPQMAAGRINQARYQQLAACIKKVLTAAIKHGGTTLRDFLSSDGKPGYFRNQLQVYGRTGKTCLRCSTLLKTLRLNQRATVFCPHCQKKK